MVMKDGEKKPTNYRLYFSYAGMVICVIFVCTILCFYSRIKIAIKIM